MAIGFHCPLCVQPLHQDPAIIFLDMDGVMIKDRSSSPTQDNIRALLKDLFSRDGRDRYTELEWRTAAAYHLDVDPLVNLNLLINKIKKTRAVQIVLSSDWRNDGTLEEIREKMFAMHSFSPLIIGKTPPENSDKGAPEIISGYDFEKAAKDLYHLKLTYRADQIEFWLRNHGFDLNTSDYVIFDDADLGLSERFPNNFVFTRPLDTNAISKALKILNIT